MKGLLALSGASLVRTLRKGPRAGRKSLEDAYHAVDPFSAAERRRERLLLQRIPERPLTKIVAWPEEIALDLRYADVSGSTPIRDMAVILALAIAQQPKAVLEFGTFFGSATANLARNLPEAIVHTIDLPPDPVEAQRLTEGKPVDDVNLIESRQLGRAFRGTPFERRIVQHEGDTATYDYSRVEGEVSFFLIDGSHTYEYAKSDTLRAFALAQGPSTFVWHDCDEIHPGVTQWLGELLDAGLAVERIEGTVVACLRVEAGDARVRRVIQGEAQEAAGFKGR